MKALVVLLSAALLASCGSERHKDANAGPARLRPLNLVVVTIDTLRPDHLGCYGNRNIDTPVLDGLARRGVLFEQAVAQAPLTPPSHASIFTGQYPTVHHVRNTGGFALPSTARPLARILQEQGWDTAAFVSSVALRKSFGFGNGFAAYDDQMSRPENTGDVREEPARPAGATIDRATAWLNGQSGKPWFLWVHLYDPHRPYNPPADFLAKYPNRPYDAEIAYADQQLGRLFEAVKKKAPADATLIAVLSDHGEGLHEHGEFTHGVFLYDSTLRIAFMMAGPGVPRGLRVKQQVRSIDFLPTILELMGGAAPADIQGSSLLPAFSGKSVATEVSYEETLFPKIDMGWSELRGIRTSHWKYIRAPKPELYDLVADPGETANVIAQHPAEVQKFEAHLAQLVPNGREKVRDNLVDARTMEQLRSLGYLSGFSPREYDLQGAGADPKDRVGILNLLEQVESSGSRLPESRKIALLQTGLAEDGTNPRLYFELGREFERAGQYEGATRVYEAALAKGIDSATLHARLAQLAIRAGDRPRAIAEFEKATRLDPLDVESQCNLGMAYMESGSTAQAERVFSYVLTVEPESAAAHNGLGLIAIQKHDLTGARDQFQKAVASDPNLVEADMNLGLLYEMTGDRDHARACFEEFVKKASPVHYATLIRKVKDELVRLQ